MRVLIVSPRMPPPPAGQDFGGDKRLRLFVEGLKSVFDQFSFLYFVPAALVPAADDRAWTADTVWGVEGVSVFAPLASRDETFANHYLRGLVSARHVKALFPFCGAECVEAVRAATAAAPDLVFVHELNAMLPVLSARPQAPILFDLSDLIDRTQWRAATARPFRLGNIGHALQTPAILAAERQAVRRAARTAVCSEGDRRFVARLGAGRRAVTTPNAVPAPEAPPPLTDAPNVVFLGNYGYVPNVMAVTRLLTRIWPLIRRVRPDARLLLAGGSVKNLPALASTTEGVEVLGFVKDLNEIYAQARVVCCPIDVGGGTRLKLIEAAAYARPMVSTRVGAENLEFRDGTEILLRDDDAGFAQACAELLADAGRCRALGAAARMRMTELYEAGAVRRQVAALAQEMLAGDDL